MGTMCAALALTFVLATLLEKNIADDDMGQRPVLPPGYRPKPPGKEGQWCAPYRHCQPQLCCLRLSNRSKLCQPKAQLGQPCSDGPVKGDIYHGNCPCLTGTCESGYCIQYKEIK
uniref:Putative ixodegrin protein n=1 Tax=Ixodes ricinus TaxID=34613 RepID=A0A0K8RDY1_IXORI